MAISKITRNYQITIPKEIREDVNLRIGDSIYLFAENEDIKISKNLINIVRKSFGIWKEIKGDSVEYVNKIRNESEKRRKRLGL